MPFVANEIYNCEMAFISQKFFTPVFYTSKQFTDIQMTPTSQQKSQEDTFETIKFNKSPDQQKSGIEIIFEDDEVEMQDMPE